MSVNRIGISLLSAWIVAFTTLGITQTNTISTGLTGTALHGIAIFVISVAQVFLFVFKAKDIRMRRIGFIFMFGILASLIALLVSAVGVDPAFALENTSLIVYGGIFIITSFASSVLYAFYPASKIRHQCELCGSEFSSLIKRCPKCGGGDYVPEKLALSKGLNRYYWLKNIGTVISFIGIAIFISSIVAPTQETIANTYSVIFAPGLTLVAIGLLLVWFSYRRKDLPQKTV